MTKAPVRFEAEEMYRVLRESESMGDQPLYITDHVNARLADYFKDAAVVTGYRTTFGRLVMSDAPDDGHDTHRGLVIGLERLQQGVSKDEILSALRSAKIIVAAGTKLKPGDIEMHPDLQELADRIEREGIKP